MGYISKLSAKNIGNFGVTFGLKDVTPSVKIADYNINLFKEKNKETRTLINSYFSKIQEGEKSIVNLNFEDRAELESDITRKLNSARDEAGKYLLESLSLHNNGYIMAVSGAKGSSLNICQMMSTVGQ